MAKSGEKMIYSLCSSFSNPQCQIGNGWLLSGSTASSQRRHRHNRFVKLTAELRVFCAFLPYKSPYSGEILLHHGGFQVKTFMSPYKKKKGQFVLLTSTCIQTLYFLQTSEMAMRGSKAPYTVVPAVALTKKGTKPCKGTNKKDDFTYRKKQIYMQYLQLCN